MSSLRRICIQTMEVAAGVASALRTMIGFRPDQVLASIHRWPLDDIDVRQMRKHANSRKKMKVLDVSVDVRAQMRVRALSLGTYGMIVKSPR